MDDFPEVDEQFEEYELGRSRDPAFARVAFAVIEPASLGAVADPTTVRAALVPGTRVERHNRTWLMGQVHDEEDRSVVGRIGFQSAAMAEVWDEEKVDFRDEMLRSGVTSPFVLDPEYTRVVFQLRTGLIRPRSFTGALQALMNAASPTERWRVFPAVEKIDFDSWRESVERITKLRVRLRRPNPHYGNRDDVRRLIEGANARMAAVMWDADPEDPMGIDIDEPFIQEALEHAQQYGDTTATGDKRGVPSRWGSVEQGAVSQIELPADPQTNEVSSTALRSTLDLSPHDPPTDADVAPNVDAEGSAEGA